MRRITCLLAFIFVLSTSFGGIESAAISVNNTPAATAAAIASATVRATATPTASAKMHVTATPTVAATPPASNATLDRLGTGDWEAAYAEAVESIKVSLTDVDALYAAYQTFDGMKGFHESDGFALLTRALIAIAHDGFANAQQLLETLRLSGFDAALKEAGIPSSDALIGYCEGRVAEGGSRYYDAYQAYVDSGALDSLSRAAAIQSEKAESLYVEAANYEAKGDLERATEVFGMLGGYNDSRERLSKIVE